MLLILRQTLTNTMKQLIDLILQKIKWYGEDSRPLTMGLLREILLDIQQDLDKNKHEHENPKN